MLLVLTLIACFNDCSYFEACDGDTLLVCGEGPDQSFNRKVNEVPCEAPNDVCVDVGEQNASCAHSGETCVEGAARCDGDLLVVCEPFDSMIGLLSEGSDVSLEQAYDCAADGMVCGEDDAGAAACVAAE